MPKQLTQGRVMTAMNKGALLMKIYINEPPSQAGVFYKLTSGQAVRSDLVARMVKDGLIRECKDGLDLLGASSQTYEIVRSQ